MLLDDDMNEINVSMWWVKLFTFREQTKHKKFSSTQIPDTRHATPESLSIKQPSFTIRCFTHRTVDSNFFSVQCSIKPSSSGTVPEATSYKLSIETRSFKETWKMTIELWFIQFAEAKLHFNVIVKREEIEVKCVSFTVDSRHLKECIERAEFSLNLELWFGEQQQPPSQQADDTINGSIGSFSDTNLMLASTRTLQLNFHPGRGLHYHLPVLFDYFHLAAVSLGIHASLIALHQPYIKWVFCITEYV